MTFSLDFSKSSGLSRLHMKVLGLEKNYIYEQLSGIINQSCRSPSVPKLAQVI